MCIFFIKILNIYARRIFELTKLTLEFFKVETKVYIIPWNLK